MKIDRTPSPFEDQMNEESRQFLAYLRRLPEYDDPNDWLTQILAHLRLTPADRMARWAGYINGNLRFYNYRFARSYSEFDPSRVLSVMVDHEVSFVMVGMGAAYVQGVPFPSYNLDITPRLDRPNTERLEAALQAVNARQLEVDESGPVEEPTLPGFRRLDTAMGMVNIVDRLPGVGGYGRLMESADLLDVRQGLSVWVASIEDVIVSKETVGALYTDRERIPSPRMMDAVHVLMCRETLDDMREYAHLWNRSHAS